MKLTFESTIKARPEGTHVPFHPGLKVFTINKPCSVCGRAGNLEQNGVRYDAYCWRAKFHK